MLSKEKVEVGGKKQSKEEMLISVVVPVVERYDDIGQLYSIFAAEVEKLTGEYEFIFIIDGHMKRAYQEIKKISSGDPHVRFVLFPKILGESNALSVGFEMARGRYIFTLSSYFQVEPDEIKKLYNVLMSEEADIVIASRMREKDSLFNRFRSKTFHKLLKAATGSSFNDISCGMRVIKREVVQALDVYGDLHRFIPLLAEHRGFRVREVKVRQVGEDARTKAYNLKTYFSRFIDLATLFFLLRFTSRPMKFFGLIGSVLVFFGISVNVYLIYFRLFTSGFGLTNKPSLFLSSLLIVIGIQIFAIGLIGEIIIYTHGRKMHRFHIKETVDE